MCTKVPKKRKLIKTKTGYVMQDRITFRQILVSLFLASILAILLLVATWLPLIIIYFLAETPN